MATLEQLAQSGRTQQATITTASGANVAPEVTTPASKLAGDLMGIMGQTGKTVQQANTLSVGAAKRVAIQNLTDMANDLEALKGNVTPDMDPRDIQAANMAVYQHYGKVKFDNADAQEAFDGMYHGTGSQAIAKQNSVLEKEANKRDAIANKTNNLEGLSAQYRQGIMPGKEQIDAHIDSITAGGYYTKAQAQEMLAETAIQNLQGNYETYKNMPIYNPDGTINKPEAANLYNYIFKQSQMDSEGKVFGTGDTTEAVVNAEQNAFRALMDFSLADQSKKRSLALTTPTADMNGGSANIRTQINAYSNAIDDHLISNDQLGIETPPSELQKTAEGLARLNAEFTAVQNIEGRLAAFFSNKISYDDLTNEGSVPYKISGGVEFVPITKGLIDNYIERSVRSAEDELTSTTDPKKRVELTRALTNLTKNSYGQIKTPGLNKIVDNVANGLFPNGTASEVTGSFATALEYNSAFGLDDNSKWVNSSTQKTLAVHENRIKQEVADGKLSPVQGKMQIEAFMYIMKEAHNMERPTIRKIETELKDRGGDIQIWTIGTQDLVVGAKSIFAKMVDPARINNPGYISDLVDKHTLTLSSEWAIPGWNSGITIVKPEGSPETDKAITDKIMGETLLALKETKIAPNKITSTRMSLVQTQLPNGQRATGVLVYDNNDEIVYDKVYNDVELITPLTMAQRTSLDGITKNKYSASIKYNPLFKKGQGTKLFGVTDIVK